MNSSSSEERMKKMESIRSRTTIAAILLGGGVIILFCIIPLVHPHNTTTLGILGFCLIIAGIFFCSGLVGDNKKLYKETFVEETIKKNFDNVFYAWKTGFSKDDIIDFKLFRNGLKYKSEDYLKATHKGIDFEMSDIMIVYDTSKDGKFDTFQGRVMVFDFPNKTIEPTRIISKSFYSRNGINDGIVKNSEKVEMENTAFNNAFLVYSTNPHDSFYLLTPHFMERLMVLKEKYNSIALCFEYNKVIVAFNENGKHNAFDGSMINEKLRYSEEIAKVQSDIDDLKYIIETIRLIG